MERLELLNQFGAVCIHVISHVLLGGQNKGELMIGMSEVRQSSWCHSLVSKGENRGHEQASEECLICTPISVCSFMLWNLESKPECWREAVSGIAFYFYLGRRSQVICKIGKTRGNNTLV